MEKRANEKAADRQYQNDIAARDEQRVYDRDALKRLVVDAEAAGFNPLTVLRNGATAYQNSGAPLISRREVGGSPAGQAIASAGENFMNNFDPYADSKREQSYRLVESQIAALNAGILSTNRQSTRRAYAQGDYERRPSGKAGQLASRELRDQDGAIIRVGAGSMASDWEDEYGEVAGELEGLPRYLRDRVWPSLKNPKTWGFEKWPSFKVDTPPYQRLRQVPQQSGGGAGW